MTIRALIERRLRASGQVRTSEITRKTGLSRTYIHRVFQELQREGRVRLIGKANRARYVDAKAGPLRKALAHELSYHRMLRNRNLEEDKILAQIKAETAIFTRLQKGVARIIDYSFMELLNNAIEHSRSPRISVRVARNESGVSFNVKDHGVGIFRNIMRTKGLRNELEAIQDLLKGKQTTAPQAHSGEGIFFTSKVVDLLEFRSSQKRLTFSNRVGDVFLRDTTSSRGTQVDCWVSLNSKQNLERTFREYSDEGFAFDRTSVAVELYKVDDGFVSRSQARRILAGLDRFKRIVLDFKNVETVGQAFADEVFRVWRAGNPRKRVEVRNANRNILFMIERAREARPGTSLQ